MGMLSNYQKEQIIYSNYGKKRLLSHTQQIVNSETMDIRVLLLDFFNDAIIICNF